MREEKINICMEAAVELHVNGEKLVTFMCTPFNLEEMAVGYLCSRGIIRGMDEIEKVESVSVFSGIEIKLRKNLDLKKFDSPKMILSGCGTGMGFDLEELKQKRLERENSFEMKKLKEKFIEMLGEAIMYKTMGGMHCAALYNPVTDEFIVREDIGRHNAVDKVIGAGIMQGVELGRSAVIVTGRISSDMVIKAGEAGIPLVVSRSLTSDLALSIAEELGISLIGRANIESPIIYYRNPSTEII